MNFQTEMPAFGTYVVTSDSVATRINEPELWHRFKMLYGAPDIEWRYATDAEREEYLLQITLSIDVTEKLI